MEGKIEAIKSLKIHSEVYFSYSTWFVSDLHSSSTFGTASEFHRHLVLGIVRKIKKNPKVFVIHFPALESSTFSPADLKNDLYFFSVSEIPDNAVILEKEIPLHDLFPSPLASEMVEVPNNSRDDLVSFKRKFLEVGLMLPSKENIDKDDTMDHGSKYFYISA